MRRTFLTFFCAVATSVATAQTPDTLRLPTAPDSAVTPMTVDKTPWVRGFFTRDYPNPRKAGLFALVVPGSGQVYNKKYWKLPIVYGVLGGLTWLEIRNINQYQALRVNYMWLVDGREDTFPTESPYTEMDATTMRNYRDEWKRYVELSSLILGLAYVLTAVDAFVDAQLSTFDVSDDLSLRLQPVATPTLPALGIGVGYALNGATAAQAQQRTLRRARFTAP